MYLRETNIHNNHGDEYAYSLSFSIDNDDCIHVVIDERFPRPYEASDIYVGLYNWGDFTTCDESAAANYEEYFIADFNHEIGYLITPRDAQLLTKNGKVTIGPLGHESDDGVRELINDYLNS